MNPNQGGLMKDILVKDVMIQISNYVTVNQKDTVLNVFQILENKKDENSGHTHRDAIVVNDKGEFCGKITMIDIFRVLEPNYKRLFKNRKDGFLTAGYAVKAMLDFNLWIEPMRTLCERGSTATVSEAMHKPEDNEYIQEDDSLEKALHSYVMGAHQPLIVKKGDETTGMLRFGDLFEIIRKEMLACPI